MVLFIDTETTGLPADWNAPADDTDNWPRLVQLAWMLADDTGMEHAAANHVIKPEGFDIPDDAVRIHGITTETAIKTGISLVEALDELAGALQKSELVAAHNISFDEKVISAECIRTGKQDVLMGMDTLCVMKAATAYCRLPGRYGYKWPSLTELYTRLFNQIPEQLHNADIDMRMCARCYFELRKRGIL